MKSNSEVRIGHVISSCKETCDQKSGYYIGDLISRRCDVRTGDHISPRMNAISRHAVLYESHIFLRIFSTKWKPKPRTVQACHVLKKLAVIQLTSMPLNTSKTLDINILALFCSGVRNIQVFPTHTSFQMYIKSI